MMLYLLTDGLSGTETGCENICGAATTLAVKGQMMMMMMSGTKVNPGREQGFLLSTMVGLEECSELIYAQDDEMWYWQNLQTKHCWSGCDGRMFSWYYQHFQLGRNAQECQDTQDSMKLLMCDCSV